MKSFSLEKGDRIFIYGAGALGRRIFDTIKAFYIVEGFIDRRASDITRIPGIKLFSPEEIPQIYRLNDCAVIVCVHNALWHFEICELLYSKGFDKIIFLAVDSKYDTVKATMMNKFYNDFMSDMYCLENVPFYKELYVKKTNKDILYNNNSYVTCLFPIELLFSSGWRIEEKHNYKKIRPEHELYMDKPIVAYRPYLELFNYLMYGTGTPELFLNLFRDINNSVIMTDTEFLASKWKLYQMLETEYLKGWDYLKYSPIYADWNDRGYVNILDGHHRAIFYYLKGLRMVPVRLTKTDYEKYMQCANRFSLREGAVTTWDLISRYFVYNQKRYNIIYDASSVERKGELSYYIKMLQIAGNIVAEQTVTENENNIYDCALFEDKIPDVNAKEILLIASPSTLDFDSMQKNYILKQTLGCVSIEGHSKNIKVYEHV